MPEMQWFGTSWGSALNRDLPQSTVPIGERCAHCTEGFEPTDKGIRTCDGGPYHYECFMRTIIGSLAHVEERCSCYIPGSDENDHPDLTRRQAAKLALKVWESRQC